jgi:hypothetical protein
MAKSNSGLNLSPAMRRAMAHFDALQSRSIEVPEWGSDDEPFVIFWKPWTAAEKRKVFPEGRADTRESMVDILFHKALDDKGERMFKMQDRHFLLTHAHDTVVGYVAASILLDLNPDPDKALTEQAEKN